MYDWLEQLEVTSIISSIFSPVDCYDVPIQEPCKFNRKWYSHKFNSSSLRYEVALSLRCNYLFWVHRPFSFGKHADLKIIEYWMWCFPQVHFFKIIHFIVIHAWKHDLLQNIYHISLLSLKWIITRITESQTRPDGQNVCWAGETVFAQPSDLQVQSTKCYSRGVFFMTKLSLQ